MDNNITIKSLLTDIGDAIREKNGETDKIIANEMPNKIRALSTSGGSNEIWYPEVNDNDTNFTVNVIYSFGGFGKKQYKY